MYFKLVFSNSLTWFTLTWNNYNTEIKTTDIIKKKYNWQTQQNK